MKARRRFGQHFLEPPWAARVLDAAAPAATDAFLEIGPGRGALTVMLARRAAEVVAVEIDRDLAAALARKVPANVRVVAADVLQIDIEALLASCTQGGRRRVIGNLPYNVSTPILFRLLDKAQAGRAIHDATLMVQREVAARLVAAPGGSEYGVLSILSQAQADVARLLEIPPGAFRPVPKVHSTLVRLTFGPRHVPPELAASFGDLVRSMFTQRRKVLANALKPLAAVTGVPAEGALAAAALDGRRRPQTLQLEELVRLAAVFASAPRPPVL